MINHSPLILLLSLSISIFCFRNGFAAATADSVNPDSVKTLMEVTVVKELTERHGNRESVTVTKAMRDRSRDAGEMLKGLTGIYYDPLSTEVRYLGSDKVVILVDSVQKSADYIKRMNPKRFDRIDIISFPDGKYAGYEAVINYHTKPQYIGYDGVVKGEAVILPDGYNGQGREFNSSNDVAEFTYTREKLNVAISGSYDFSQTGSTDYHSIQYPLNSLTETSIPRSKKDPASDMLVRSVSSSASLDYQINHRHSLSLTYRIRPDNIRQITDMAYEMDYGSALRDTVGIDSYNKSKSVGHTIGAFYRGKLKNRWTLDGTLSYNFSNGDYDYRSDRSTGYTTRYRSHYNSRYLWGGFDIAHTTKNRKLSYGLSEYITDVRYEQTRIYGDISDSRTDELRSRSTVSLSYFPSRSLSLGGYAGLSTVHRSNRTQSKTYAGPRGRLWVNRFFGRNNGLRLNYTVQQLYPGLSQIQDYGYFRDSLLYTKGNPGLKPALNHNFTLTGFFNNGLTAKIDYTLTTSESFLMREAGWNTDDAVGFPDCYVVETYRQGTASSLKFNLSYYRSLSRYFALSADGSIERKSARAQGFERHKTMPGLSWWVSYSNIARKLTVYVSGSAQQSLYVTPQETGWGTSDGFSVSVQKIIPLRRGSLLLLAMWHSPWHLGSGRFRRVTDSTAYRSHSVGDNQFRSDNRIQLTAVLRLSGGEKTRHYDRNIESVE